MGPVATTCASTSREGNVREEIAAGSGTRKSRAVQGWPQSNNLSLEAIEGEGEVEDKAEAPVRAVDLVKTRTRTVPRSSGKMMNDKIGNGERAKTRLISQNND